MPAKMSLQTALTLNAAGYKEGVTIALKETAEFQKAIGGASKETIKAFKDISQMGIGEMKKNLLELKRISFAGKSKEEIAAINARIGELMDTMGDLRAEQQMMGTEFGTAMAKGLQTLSAVGEIGVGVASAFGANEEEAAKYQRAMVTLIGVTQALGVVQDAIETKQLQSIALKIKDATVTAAQTVATTAATAATWAMNASLLVVIGTIGAAVVVVGAIVYGITRLVGAHNDAAEAAERQALAEKALDDRLKSMKINNEQMLKLAKARGASERELKQLEIGSTYQYLQGLKQKLDGQLELNGVRKKGVSDEDRQKLLDEFEATSNALDVMKVELDNVTDKTTAHTKAINDQTSALAKWIDTQNKAAEKAKELAQYDVPVPSFGQTGSSDVSLMQSKGISGNPAALGSARDVTNLISNYKKIIIDITELTRQGLSDLAGVFAQGIADMITGDGGLGQFFSGFLSAIGSFLKQMGAAVVAYAITMEAFKKAFTNPFAAIAAGLGLMVAGGVVMNYAQKLQKSKFAAGGIVGGNSYSGDKVPSLLNSGEMVLNQAQQSRLFAMVNGSGGGGREVVFRIDGQQLVGVLNNHSRKVQNTR